MKIKFSKLFLVMSFCFLFGCATLFGSTHREALFFDGSLVIENVILDKSNSDEDYLDFWSPDKKTVYTVTFFESNQEGFKGRCLSPSMEIVESARLKKPATPYSLIEITANGRTETQVLSRRLIP